MGGMDDQGHPIVVAIDESNSFHRKYHRGQWREGHWVFAGIESGTGKCFLIEVSDRTAATLQPLIQRYILQGSHIMSDGWPSYANIDQLTNWGMASTCTLSLCIRDILSILLMLTYTLSKRKLRRQFGTSHALFPSYLHEFVFRSRFRGQDMFHIILKTIAENYPL